MGGVWSCLIWKNSKYVYFRTSKVLKVVPFICTRNTCNQAASHRTLNLHALSLLCFSLQLFSLTSHTILLPILSLLCFSWQLCSIISLMSQGSSTPFVTFCGQ